MPVDMTQAWPADQVERWPLSKLIPFARNARTHSREQIKQIAASMTEWGWTVPVLIDEAGGIIAGHARCLAAELLGYDEAPVMIARGWSDAKKRAYVLADNKLALNAGWDEALLAGELAELEGLGFNLALTGFAVGEIDSLLKSLEVEPEAALAVPAVPISRPGDLWRLGPHRVICGDATDAAVVHRVLGERQPILMVTDPPYGLQLDSEWRDRAGLNGNPDGPDYVRMRVAGHYETTVINDDRADWSEAYELVPSIQVAYVWYASVFTREVLSGLERIGFEFPQQIIWNKMHAALTRTLYWFQHEPCWFARKKNAPWYGKRGENTTVWDAVSPKMVGSDEEKYDHPTQKPIELMTRPILNHLTRGGLVYDPFLGTGTTLAAAEVTDRVCCGVEIDPKYVDVIVRRWQAMTGNNAALEDDGRTFDQIQDDRIAMGQSPS
jgi:DNA modification methylase